MQQCSVCCFLFPATTTKTVTEATNLGPKLKDIGCRRPEDCSDVDGTYCDADLGMDVSIDGRRTLFNFLYQKLQGILIRYIRIILIASKDRLISKI